MGTNFSPASSAASFRGAGRLAYRTGGFPHHACREMRIVVGRELTTAERQYIVDGWAAERREVAQ